MFKGETEIQVKNKRTLEITRTIRQKNSMTLLALGNLFYRSRSNWTSAFTNTFTGTEDNITGIMLGYPRTSSGSGTPVGYVGVGKVENNTVINEASLNVHNMEKTGNYVRGSVIPGEVQPVGFVDFGTKTAELTFKGRVPPPTQPIREINLVQVGYSTTSTTDQPGNPGFAVVLDTPCIQTDEEILDVFYRVSIVGNAKDPEDILWKTLFFSRLFPRFYDSFVDGNEFGDSSTGRRYGVRGTTVFGYKLAPERKVIRTRIDSSTGSGETNDKYFSQLTGRYTFSYDLGSNIGNTYASVYNFTSSTPMGNYFSLERNDFATRSFSQQVFPRDINPVQSIFKHTSNAIRPYLDPSFLGASTADVIINGENFNKESSNVYKIVYPVGGNINQAQYRLEKKVTFGYPGGAGGEYIDEVQRFKHMMTLPSQGVDSTTSYYERNQVAQPDDGIVATNEGLLHYKRGLNEWIMFPTAQKLDSERMIWADAYGISVLDLYTDDYINYDEFSSPALPVTGLTDYCIDEDGTVWLASRNEGLFRLDPDLNTIERIEFSVPGVSDEACYSVDFKNNGDLFAVFNGALMKSIDKGTSWEAFNETTPTKIEISGVTDGNWQSVQGIVIDKDHPDDRMLFVLKTNDNIGWWSRAGSNPNSNFVISDIPIDFDGNNNLGYIRNYDSGFPVRKWIKYFPETDGFFVLLNNHDSSANPAGAALRSTLKTVQFAGNSVVASNSTGTTTERLKYKHVSFEKDSNGVTRVWWGRVPTNLGSAPVIITLRDQSLNIIEDYSEYNSTVGGVMSFSTGIADRDSFYCEYIGNGISLLCRRDFLFLHQKVVSSAADGGAVRHIIWDTYGWNGSEWEKNHIGLKPVHETEEPLIDGLTIRFEPGGTPQFVQGEYVTAYLFRGIHKDNATSTSWSFAYHLRPTLDLTDLSSGQIPAVAKGQIQNRTLDFSTHNTGDTNIETEIYQIKGIVGRGSSDTSTRVIHSEIKFEGDFSVSFKTSKTGREDSNARATFGVTPISTLPSISGWVDAQYLWWFSRFNLQGLTGTTLTGTTVTVVPNDATWTGEEVFTLERIGTELYYKINGVTVHTQTGASTEPMVAVVALRSEDFRTFYDMNIDYYTENRRIVELGDTVDQSGVFDPDFCMVEAWLTPRTCKVTIDGQEAPLIVDTLQDPQAGQAVLLPKTGWLVFDEADEGLNITAQYQAMYSIQASS